MTYKWGITTLRNACIRFTQPTEFNDPFEISPYIELQELKFLINQFINDIFENDDFYNQIIEPSIENTYNQLPVELTNHFKYDVFKNIINNSISDINIKEIFFKHINNDDLLVLNSYKNILTEIKENLCILSLTKHYDSVLMWSHYGDSHKGVVLEFDSTHPYFNQSRNTNDYLNSLHEVSYSDKRPQLINLEELELLKTLSDEQQLVDIRDQLIKKLLFSKSIDWKYEDEYRVVRPRFYASSTITNNSNKKQIHLFNLPVNIITGILLGANISKDKQEEIANFLQSDKRYKHVKLSKIVLHQEKFQLLSEPIEV